MIITSGRDLIRYIQNNKLEDYPVGVGCEGYSNDPKDLDTDISVDLTYDGRLLIHDNSYYDELERGEIEGSTMRKFAKYSQGYIKASSDDSEYVLTAEGRRKVKRYVRELDAKRKEILDAGKDTIDETPNPVTVDDIVSDLNWGGVDENGEYLNGWYVTDNYDSDYPICLQLGVDFIEE